MCYDSVKLALKELPWWDPVCDAPGRHLWWRNQQGDSKQQNTREWGGLDTEGMSFLEPFSGDILLSDDDRSISYLAHMPLQQLSLFPRSVVLPLPLGALPV